MIRFMAFIFADLHAIRFLFDSALALGNVGLIDRCQTRRAKSMFKQKNVQAMIQFDVF